MTLSDEARAAAVWWFEGLSDDMRGEVLDAYRAEGGCNCGRKEEVDDRDGAGG